jgi:hypothetical protein
LEFDNSSKLEASPTKIPKQLNANSVIGCSSCLPSQKLLLFRSGGIDAQFTRLADKGLKPFGSVCVTQLLLNTESRFKIVSSSAEAELLVHCARLDVDASRAARIQSLAGSQLDWNRMLTLAQRNALVPLLYFQLNANATESVSPERLGELRLRFQNNSALNVLLTGELLSLLELFERNEIPAIPYKGPAFSVAIYGKLSLRQFADLDILVPEKDVWKATELLIDRGYQAHFVIPARKRASFIRLSYVRLFERESDSTTVELHWRLAPRFFGTSFDIANIWQHARMIPLQGKNVRVPQSSDLVLMLCIHGAKDCWERLEWVCSLAEVIRSNRELDWQDLLERARAARCLAIVSLGLLLAHDLLEAPVPAYVLTTLGPRKQLDMITNEVATRCFSEDYASLTVAQRIRFHLQVMDSLGEKIRYCLRLALTTTPVDWELMQLPDSASFLYRPLRLLRLLKKYGGTAGQRRSKS